MTIWNCECAFHSINLCFGSLSGRVVAGDPFPLPPARGRAVGETCHDNGN
jgi:hypothetical protein